MTVMLLVMVRLYNTYIKQSTEGGGTAVSDSTKKDGDLYLKYLQQAECHLAGFGDLGGKKRKAAVPQRFRIIKTDRECFG